MREIVFGGIFVFEKAKIMTKTGVVFHKVRGRNRSF
jgi:hypothetical protein